MYRQVKISPAHQNFQRILWRDNPAETIRHYRLTRVTYGLASGSHHAIRVLKESAKNSDDVQAQLVITHDCYVDDAITGAPDVESAAKLQAEVSRTMMTVGFELRKFACSDPSVINNLPEKLREHATAFELGNSDHEIKTLGVAWLPI